LPCSIAKKSPYRKDEKAIFCGCGAFVLRFLGYNNHLSQFDCFPKGSVAAKRKSDAFIQETVLRRMYNGFKMQESGGTKPSMSAENTTK
jgi:hypothetical protein